MRGVSPAKDALALELGFSWVRPRSGRLEVSYGGMAAGDLQEQSGRATLSYRF